MPLSLLSLLLAAGLASTESPSGQSPAATSGARPAYPVAARGETVDVFHGVEVADPYRWMEDLRDPALLSWIEAQNALSRRGLEQDPFFAAVRAHMAPLEDLYPDRAPGIETGGQAFHLAFEDGALSLYVQSPGDAAPRCLVDGRGLGSDLVLKSYKPSPDGRHVAYIIGAPGTDWGEVRVRDVATGKDRADVLPNIRHEGPVAWTADGGGLVYRGFDPPRDGRKEAPAEGMALRLHRLGTPASADATLFERPVDRGDWNLDFSLPGDGSQLFISIERGPWLDGNIGGSRAELGVLPIGQDGRPPEGASRRVLTEPDAAYQVLHAEGDAAWVFTNRDAPRRRVVRMELSTPQPKAWRDVVPEGDGVLTEVQWFGGRLVVNALQDVQSVVRVFDRDGKPAADVPLPGTGIVQGMLGSADSPRVWLLFSGMLQPPTVVEHNLDTGERRLQTFGQGAPDLNDFEVRQEWVASKDGTRVPMFIAARKGLARDGTHPTLLFGYGASGTSELPIFRDDAIAWLQLGGVYVLANPRGGGELGTAWYQAAIRERKQVSFDDFIAVAEHLVGEGWTSPGKLAISGGSNGGLLVTATMLQRPDLFGVVLAEVPVTDAMRRHLSGNGPQQVEQWGTPDDPEVFPALRAYSPVHNVRPGQCYPATLVATARDDDRLPPWHAYKFTAALQAAQGCDAPVLLHVRDRGGHGSAGPQDWMDSVSRQLAFAARQLGLAEPK